jgi:hypothetical protein
MGTSCTTAALGALVSNVRNGTADRDRTDSLFDETHLNRGWGIPGCQRQRVDGEHVVEQGDVNGEDDVVLRRAN